MDDIVRQAMAKWPNVPHCYGWLALDARGVWRMRDERAQHLGLAGDKLTNAALVGFINRNYACDERGCWYFQNGPQRVYVELEATPFIARTDPQQGLLVQTGAVLAPTAAYLTSDGALVLEAPGMVAQVDDRDVGSLLAALDDDALLAWLERPEGSLQLRWRGATLAVTHIGADLAARFHFVPHPQPVIPAEAGTPGA